MKIYLAARFDRRVELRTYRDELVAQWGVECTSRWLDETALDGTDQFDLNHRLAAMDKFDVLRSDYLVSFTEGPDVPGAGRGGRHVEFGIALAAGIHTVLIGPREHVFHYLANQRCEDWPAFRALLAATKAGGRL